MARNVLRIFSVFDSDFSVTLVSRIKAEALKEIPNVLFSGSFLRLEYDTPDMSRVNADRLVSRGISLIPQGVKLITNPIRGTIATLSPTERAILSIPSSPVPSGKSADIREYPGRKINRNKPRIMRMKLSLSG